MIIALQTLIFFRKSLLGAIDRLLRPYYGKILSLNRNGSLSDDEESEEHVFSEFDDERGVVFYPPLYTQRYAAVSDCLMDEQWCGKLEKVVEFGYHDMSFIKYIKEVPGIKSILGVDIEPIHLRCSSDLIDCDEYIPKRENPLEITLYQGNAADPDFRLIGCDAVVGIEVIEHMLPHDLERLVHTVFGFIKPWVVILTTPNGDFNVLFKALEKNGLRRLDHFFEWTQEQFHDWCSNIVTRYPEYTVSCKGIGPGPSGTTHLGCCSQMAVFIAKQYHKQQNLDLNSLALVADTPSPNLSDMIGSWECPEFPTEHNMLCPPDNMESYTDSLFADKQSRVTIVIASPSFSFDTLEHRDKTSQCNLDTELGKGFLMFDEEQMCFTVLVPRRSIDNRIYEFEDVNSRLNCSTLQVRKFSKTSQNLMAKNKLDSLVHTREVVDEIRHLTKVLNLNKNSLNQPENSTNIWSNINWGDNAPYWNQYYKIVKEYNYPFETKSDDCRILDLISDEINRLIDTHYDEEFSVDVNKLEIPIHHLMRIVEHITDDVDRVKDILEWNGYEIVDDLLIHSRLVVDGASVGSPEDDWHDNDTFSDWDTTDVHSTTISDGSTTVTDYHGRCLRRALDHKVRKLHTTLIGDEDVTSELDKIVCRLMKLALRVSKGRQTPPPSRWMQCKLLDMLTLTEKAIERRKRHSIESYPLKAIGYDEENISGKMVALEKFRDDNTAENIVDKYLHLVKSTDRFKEDLMRSKYWYKHYELDDKLSVTNTEFSKEIEHIEIPSPSHIDYEQVFNENVCLTKVVVKEETKLERTQAWVEEDIEVVPYPNHGINIDNSSGGTNHNTSNVSYKCKKSKRYKVIRSKIVGEMSILCKGSKSIYHKEKTKTKGKDNRLIKKVTRKNSSYVNLMRMESYKFVSVQNETYETKPRRKERRSSPSKPIPASLIDLCHPKLIEKKNNMEFKLPLIDNNFKNNIVFTTQPNYNVAVTEESFFIDIITDGMQETIALRRTIGTDAEVENMSLDNETLFRSVSEEIKVDCLYEKPAIATENVQSQTIFLNDINEPSTSKGIRHISMDVQCGPDVTPPTYAMLSATTSLTRTPKMLVTGITIGDSCTDINFKNSIDSGTYLNENNNLYKTLTPRRRSIGVRIRNSETNICSKIESSSMTQDDVKLHHMNDVIIQNVYINNTKLIKPVSSTLKVDDASSELCVTPFLFDDTINSSDIQCKSSFNNNVEILEKRSCSHYVRPKLSCGGVYVHSFKDKYESEDVVYQGEWQRYRPMTSMKWKPLVKKTRSGGKKNKAGLEEKKPKINLTKLETRAEPKKPLQIRRPVLSKSKQEPVKIEPNQKSAVLKNAVVIRSMKPLKNINKVAVKHIICKKSSKTKGTAYTGKRPIALTSVAAAKICPLVKPVSIDTEGEQRRKILNKCYIPLYLRRRNAMKFNTHKDFLNQSIDTVKTNIKINKEKPANRVPPLIRSKTEEMKKNLIKFNSVAPDNITYMVFHNGIENKDCASGSLSNDLNNFNKKDSAKKPPHSPPSINSSTCSSPNSIATVRAMCRRPKNSSARESSALSHKSKLVQSGSENTSPTRIKKLSKRCKSAKRSNGKVSDNKENIPETARNKQTNKKSDKLDKSVFITCDKSVFMVHLKTENSSVNTVTKLKPESNKSIVKIPSLDSPKEQHKPFDASVSKKISVNSADSCQVANKKDTLSDYDSFKSNIFHITESQTQGSQETVEVVPVKIASNILLSECLDTDKSVIYSHATSIINAMRQLIEETLDFIDNPYVNDMNIDSETVILSREEMSSSIDYTLSPISFKTVITNEDISNILLEKDIENALNRTFDTTLGDESIVSSTDTRPASADLDLLSFKSMTSVSKFSEYYLADSEFNAHTPNASSVRELFERKDTQMKQNPTGTIANQAFSGFSINSEPIVGDQPDYVNLIDSETGSLPLNIARQTASEELFVSGRSSGSFESCLIDEDAVVPDWLFRIISHQQSMIEVPEPSELAPMPLEVPVPLELPVQEDMFDVNGNEMEAGAGDGLGIHSDHSQDSSGQGSSLSSSTSSGQHSEAILIDPFTGQLELLREQSGNTIVIPPPPSDLSRVMEVVQNEILSAPQRRPARNQPTSDIEADISSLDTDALDSSDN